MASFLSLTAVSAPRISSALSFRRPLFQTPHSPTLHFKNHRFVIQSPLPAYQFLFFALNYKLKKNAFVLVSCYLLLFGTWSYEISFLRFFVCSVMGDVTLINLSFSVKLEVMSCKLILGLRVFYFYIYFCLVWGRKNWAFLCYIGNLRKNWFVGFNDLPWTNYNHLVFIKESNLFG